MQPQDKISFPTLITSEMLAPGIVKARHLYAYNPATGDIYYNQNGSRLSNLSIGDSGQILMVVDGLPSWQVFPQTGVAANRPTNGRFTGDQFFATDTFALSVYTGSAWKSTTLS